MVSSVPLSPLVCMHARSARAGTFLPAARRAAIYHSLTNDAHVDNAPGVDSGARGAGHALLQLSVEGPYPPLATASSGHAHTPSVWWVRRGPYDPSPACMHQRHLLRHEHKHTTQRPFVAGVGAFLPASVARLTTTGSVKTSSGACPPSYAWGGTHQLSRTAPPPLQRTHGSNPSGTSGGIRAPASSTPSALR
ncbi:hypothetical protein FB451DRAFT_1569444 [Mycena latifolia]|nr:hypothetical protein FB451DRAFT_1569444 [Mycena latifolia]